MKIGVIGAGNMGKKHIRVLSDIDEVSKILVADIDTKEEKKLKKRFNTEFYSDYKKMILAEKPIAVNICVPTFLHFKIAKWCMEHGVNVFVEKPIASKVSEAKKLINLAKKHKVLLMVGHIERFNPAVRKVKELIDKGEIGKIIAITARRLGGFPPQIVDVNIAVDLAIHDIYL